MARENEMVENYRSFCENNNRLAAAELNKINEAAEKRKAFKDNYYYLRENTRRQEIETKQLLENARNTAFADCLKAIYITALEANTLTDEGILLAESLVDNYIKENGGASKILGKVGNDSYLLSRISGIVEECARAEVDEILNGKPEYLSEGELQDKALIAAKNYIDNASDDQVKKFIENIKDEDLELPDDDENEGKSDKDEKKDKDSLDMSFDDEDEDDEKDTKGTKESSEEDLHDDEVDDDEDALEDDDVNRALGKPLDSDETNSDVTVDGDVDNKGKMFDELDKEEDVQKAIDTIRSRVADAEETFIKNNAEDKKKIDEILNRISTNVKTVQDLNDQNNVKSKVAQEAVRMDKRRINDIRTNRPLTIFEKMTRNLTLNIVKDCAVRESYIESHGQLDMNLVVESAKVLYGFLETVNTIQLENVNATYVENVLKNMK